MIGTSGTIESVQSVLIANGFDSGSITREGIAELERAIIERRWLTDLGVPGLAPERVDIFPAGLAALSAVLETLDIARVEFVDASLQHGLLYDLAARRAEENVQERTVEGWRRRFNVDRDQARRVRRLALALHAAVERAVGSRRRRLSAPAGLGRRSARDRADGFVAATQSPRRLPRRERRLSGLHVPTTSRHRVADPQSPRRLPELRVRGIFRASGAYA